MCSPAITRFEMNSVWGEKKRKKRKKKVWGNTWKLNGWQRWESRIGDVFEDTGKKKKKGKGKNRGKGGSLANIDWKAII